MLKIVAREEEFNNYDFTSARIRTFGKVDVDMTQAHLRIESRIKVTDGGFGMWPAFWMLPSDRDATAWPTGGEIDIMEYIGREVNHAHGYIHYGNAYNDRVVKGGHLFTPDCPCEDFHEYAIEKKPNEISFFFDGHKYQTLTADMVEPKFSWPFENHFHFIFNLAVGGNWPQLPDETTTFPNQMEVDYVRVYDMSSATYGHITGSRHVQASTGNELYCIEDGIAYTSLIWEVPADAQQSTASGNCISVNFGSASGYVSVTATSACGEDRRFQVPVRVDPWYEKDFALVEPDTATGSNDATLVFAAGGYTVEPDVDGLPVVRYQRNIAEPYDTIQYTSLTITNPGDFLTDDKKFFMDVRTTTTPACTHVLIQLEDDNLVTDTNYPIGRHSRFISYMTDSRDWQRLQFDLYDQPDVSVTSVNRITILFDPLMARDDVFFIRNFDVARSGCTSSCEDLPEHTCRQRAKSEAGACTDGVNNDGLGFDGDGPIDCDDSDCWDDPACLSSTPAPVTPSPVTPAPATPAPVLTTPSPVTPVPVTPAPVPQEAGASCSSNPECAALNLAGPLCCPTVDGVYLYCCENFTPTGPAPTPALPPAPDAGSSCSSNPQCARLNLEGECCPTVDGIDLYCCQGFNPTPSPVSPAPTPLPTPTVGTTCSSNPECAALELAGPNCCPTDDGTMLYCCENYVPPN